MIDPVWIATIGTVFGGVGFKMFENRLAKRKARESTGSIVVSKNYDDRWSNPEYVEMIHATRKGELDELGSILTECHCSSCTTVKGEGCGFMGCGHTDCAKICTPDKPKEIPRFRNVYVRNEIPDYAHSRNVSDPETGIEHVYYDWTDPSTGYKMAAREAKVVIDMPKAERYDLNEPKKLTIFTASGPKNISESEFREIARVANENRRRQSRGYG